MLISLASVWHGPRRYWLMWLVSLLSCTAWSAERETVTSLRPLLLRAIDLGSAQGVLAGPAVEALSRTFGTTAPVLVDVLRLQRYQQAGCAQLRVTTHQAGVKDRDGLGGAVTAPKPAELVYTLNYCRDGSMPRADELKQPSSTAQ